MKVQCSYCGHFQTLRQASSRRTSQDGKELFQCSQCHRYSPISKTQVKQPVSSKAREEFEDLLDQKTADLIRWGLEKVGIRIPRPKTREEIELEKREEERKKRLEEQSRQYQKANPMRYV